MDDNSNKPFPKYGTSLQDKLLILQARDKYVRSQRKKQTDIETAKVVAGNCADMCPEFERYFRRDNRLVVSPFEETNGEPDDQKMIKEYVRSSADQEEPLPYELRPPAVLERTMLYLARNIIDLIDGPEESCDEAGWYDFLWNRTRAIRKDITQQDLNGLPSVYLMERCARFHIYAGHRFFGQDPQFFPRINDENLVKCIQSLKDFYYDLSLKGVECPNEAEFRSYDILLNLGNSDVLRGISRLRKSVRESEAIKFAVKVHAAYSNNNYVRFFNLLREATFLAACVMHRYFGQMRFHAFRLLRRAFTVSNQQEQFAVNYVFDQLCFDEEAEFEEFCGRVGVQMDEEYIYLDKNNVYLTRNENIPAPFELIGRRSTEYIDAKKGRRALSEIIYNEKMAESPPRQPLQNSFDENGQLVETEIELDAETTVKISHSAVQAFSAKSNKENNRPTDEKQQAKPALAKGLFSQPNVFKSSGNSETTSTVTTQNLFGKNRVTFTSQPATQSSNIFGSQQSIFSGPTGNQNLFGKESASSGLFGKEQTSSNLFGKESASSTNLFGKEQTSSNLFGKEPSSSNLFGKEPSSSNLFAPPPAKEQSTNESLFGASNLFSKTGTSNLFSSTVAQPAPGLSFKVPEQPRTADDEQKQPKPKQQKLSEEELSYLSAGILQELLDEVLYATVKRHTLNVFISDRAVQMANEIMAEVFEQVTGEVCASVLTYEQTKHAELKQLIGLMSERLCDGLINEQLAELTASIARKEYLNELNAFIHTKSEVFANSYFEETFEQLLYDICLSTYQSEWRERQRIVGYIREKRGWRLAGIYFRHWKRRCDYLKRYRFMRDNFPASCMEKSPPALKRVISVPELGYEPTTKRRLTEQLNGQPQFSLRTSSLSRDASSMRSSLNLDLSKESCIEDELKQIQENLKRKERQEELSTKSKLEYARRALDNLKKVSQTFNNSLSFVRPFFSKNNQS